MKSWMWGILGAVAASLLTAFILGAWSSHEEGQEALDREAIRAIAKEVVEEELETTSGKTVGELVTEMNDTLIEVKTEVRIQGEALRALTE